MSRRRFSDAEIARALRDVEAGTRVPEVCARLGVSEITLNRWRREAGLLGRPPGPPVAAAPASPDRTASRVAALERQLEAFRQAFHVLLEPQDLERASRLLERSLGTSAKNARQLLGLPPLHARGARAERPPEDAPAGRAGTS